MQGTFYWSVIIAIPVFIFFKNKPPKSPSAGSSLEREDFFKALKSLFKN